MNNADFYPLQPSFNNNKATTLGVLGGGQLGRMFVHAAQEMGFCTAVLDPDPQSPAGRVSHHHIQANYDDETALKQLSQIAHAVTTEFENVPAQSLRVLASHLSNFAVSPSADCVAIAQNRALEKAHFDACKVACAPYAIIESDTQLKAVSDSLFPGILKTSRLGYDGKGQTRIKNRAELALAWQNYQNVPCILEKMLPLALECSVIVARSFTGEIVHFPVQRNVHENGILAITEVYEDNLPKALQNQAIDAAKSIAVGLSYVGVLCVEFFVLDNQQLIVNEIAPRPHNSGHYTIDACDFSQFDLQVRTLARLPIAQPRQHSAAIMLNLLGDLWFENELSAQTKTPQWEKILKIKGAHLHLYGKQEAKRARKMGHLTITGNDIQIVRENAKTIANYLGLSTVLDVFKEG